jgi:putative acetyltransferase
MKVSSLSAHDESPEKGPNMDLSIREDDPTREPALKLIKAHLAHSVQHSPLTSIHTLDVTSLTASDITFWTVWAGASVAGCGALKELDRCHGELKSMHTAQPFRGKGVGRRMVAKIVDEARRRSYDRLSLETGSMEAFAPARALYRRFGFEECPPFADYQVDSNSVYMTLNLAAKPHQK